MLAERQKLRHLVRIPQTDLSHHAMRGPWVHLVSQVLQLAGPQAAFLRHSERSWTSAMFSGWRHQVALSFTGRDAIEAGETLIERLPDHDFSIPGQLVADATITLVEHENGAEPSMMVELEVLVLVDG